MTADGWLRVLPPAAAAASLALMLLAGTGLLRRMPALLSGREAPFPDAGRLPVSGMARAALFMLLTRLAVILLAWAFRRASGDAAGLAEGFREAWTHWDARHYIGIAEEGYAAEGDARLRLVFFPLLPLLMRLFSPLAGGDAFAAGTAISLACASGAAAALYAVAFSWGGPARARLASLYFALNPMSVFLGCVYTESLFLFLTLSGVLLLIRGHPWAAALAGAASAFTRMPGAVFAGFFLILRLHGVRRGGAKRTAVCLLRTALVFSGFLLYLAINRRVTGDPFAYRVYQRENWFQQAGTFWGSAANTARYFIETRGESDWLWTWGFQLFAMFFGFLLLAFRQGSLPFAFSAYAFVYVAVVFSPTWLLSGARYLYGLFALPMLTASAGGGRAVHAAALAASAALLVLFVYGYAVSGSVL